MKNSFAFLKALIFLSLSMCLPLNASSSSLSDDQPKDGLCIMMKSSKDMVTDDKELKIIRDGIVGYDQDIAKTSQKLSGRQDVPTFENFLKGYQEIEVTGETNLEDAIKTYRGTLVKVDENSTLEILAKAYVDATVFRCKLEEADDRFDRFVSMMVAISVQNTLSTVNAWAETMLTEVKTGKKSKKDLIEVVNLRESEAEQTIQRLQEKKKLINEVRAKRLFLELLTSKL